MPPAVLLAGAGAGDNTHPVLVTEIGHNWPIGQSEHSQNWWAGGLE